MTLRCWTVFRCPRRCRQSRHAIVTYDPAAARALIAARYSGTEHGQALLSSIDWIEQVNYDRLEPVEDPYAELEAILAERERMTRSARLRHLIGGVAEDDPAAAAALIDSLPGRSADEAIGPLIEIWSQSDPEAAAHWLAGKNAQFAWERLNHLARRWGSVDFDSASAYGDALTGAHRSAFLTGLADAAPRRSTGEMLDWLSRYERDQAYPDLVGSIAQRVASDDFGAALTLIDTLPLDSRMESLMGIVPALVMQNPRLPSMRSSNARTKRCPTSCCHSRPRSGRNSMPVRAESRTRAWPGSTEGQRDRFGCRGAGPLRCRSRHRRDRRD